MEDVSDYAIVRAMETYGGGFARALAAAAFKADQEHLARIKAAFPELWAEYAELAQLKMIGGAGRQTRRGSHA
jgi:hypothetical protein